MGEAKAWIGSCVQYPPRYVTDHTCVRIAVQQRHRRCGCGEKRRWDAAKEEIFAAAHVFTLAVK